MECNKDEAVRARVNAERKLLERDFAGAKKFALKAQTLFPKLDGISQFLNIIDVYLAEKNKIGDHIDYYKVIGVDRSADEESLRKGYKKLALALHPDKNKSVGADGAFKVLSEAWSVLSDKDKRRAYDLNLNPRTSVNQRPMADNQQNPATSFNVPNFGGSSSSSSARNPVYANRPIRVPTRPRSAGTSSGVQNIPTRENTSENSAGPTTSSRNDYGHQKMPPRATDPQFIPRDSQQGPSRHPSTTETFWTVCSRCRMQYAYKKIYLNQNLICPHCFHVFIASETLAPDGHGQSSGRSGFFQQGSFAAQSSSRSMPASASIGTPTAATVPPDVHGRSSGRSGFFQQGSFAAQSSSRSMPASASRGAPTAATVPPSVENLKRKHEEMANMATASKSQHQRSTRTEKGEASTASETHSSGLRKEKQPKKQRTDVQNQNSGKEGVSGTSGLKKASVNLKESSSIDTRGMLMAMARKVINGKLDEWTTADPKKSSDAKKAETMNTSENAPKEHPANDARTDKNGDSISADKLQPPNSSTDTDEVDPNGTVSMSVPDADFHNFDNDRVERSFAANQVWAAYDDDDGMPRFYAVIHRVISRDPFKMQMSWLNSKTSSEFGSLEWTEHGFTKTSGDFRVGNYKEMVILNSFSHPVKWRKGTKGSIQIFPTKGDVWALYKNWSPDWDELTPDEIIHKYDLVMVLQDYDIDEGVVVLPLVKVPGFTSVFRQRLDQTEIQRIPRQEMFRFSHQVPSHKLDDEEKCRNIPHGCYELDPAALPKELLSVAKGDDEKKGEKIVEHPVEQQATGSGSSMERRGVLLTYSRKAKGKNKVEDHSEQGLV